MSGSDGSEAGAFFLGIVIGSVAAGSITIWSSSIASENWRRAAVKHGAAEYITTEQGTPEWRWKEVKDEDR
jgi:hypothetical protein